VNGAGCRGPRGGRERCRPAIGGGRRGRARRPGSHSTVARGSAAARRPRASRTSSRAGAEVSERAEKPADSLTRAAPAP